MKAIIFVKKNGKFWTTSFQIGVQTFRIDNGGKRPKEQAQWYAKNLELAFLNVGVESEVEER